VVGKYYAAVIDKDDGKPHIVKRADKPAYRVVPELFGGGTLPRKELHVAAEALTAGRGGTDRHGRADDREGVRRVRDARTEDRQHSIDAPADELIAAFKD
jgi:hypothetical protein